MKKYTVSVLYKGQQITKMIWTKEKSLIGVEMPFERLKSTIDSYKNKSYEAFKKNK